MNVPVVWPEARRSSLTTEIASVATDLRLDIGRQRHDAPLILPNYRALTIERQPPITIDSNPIPVRGFPAHARLGPVSRVLLSRSRS